MHAGAQESPGHAPNGLRLINGIGKLERKTPSFAETGLAILGAHDPFLVWHRLWRPIVLSAALLMHLGITVSMGLGAFSAAMLTGCLAFVPPWVLRSLMAPAPPRPADPPVGAPDGARGERARARGRSR